VNEVGGGFQQIGLSGKNGETQLGRVWQQSDAVEKSVPHHLPIRLRVKAVYFAPAKKCSGSFIRRQIDRKDFIAHVGKVHARPIRRRSPGGIEPTVENDGPTEA